MNTHDQLQALARDAGVTAWVHATRLSGPPGEVTLRGQEPVAIASLYKLPLAVAWADLVETGDLHPHERITLTPAGRVFGSTGISTLSDTITLSQRDLVRLMLTLSDNTAGDVILRTVGLARLNGWIHEAGLHNTVVRHGTSHSLRIVQAETGAANIAMAESALTDVESDIDTSEYDPAFASSSTAADICRLLTSLWSLTGQAHEVVRHAMAHQAWRHRIGSGFPHDDVTIHAKTGTLGRLRHEAAVITYPDEHPVAVTVLTRAARPERHLPTVDAAIGTLAREAVTPLRAVDPAIHITGGRDGRAHG